MPKAKLVKIGKPYEVIVLGRQILVPKVSPVDVRTATYRIHSNLWIEPGGSVVSTDDIEKYCRRTGNSFRIEEYYPHAG